MADIFPSPYVEKFEEAVGNGDDGYDIDDWSEIADTNCTVEPDDTAVTALAGSGTYVLGVHSDTNTNEHAYIYRQFTDVSTIYARAYFLLDAESWGNNDGQSVLMIHKSASSYFCARITCVVGGGTTYFRGEFFDGVGLDVGSELYAVSLDTWYRLEIEWVSGTSVEFRVYIGHGTTPVLEERITTGVGTQDANMLVVGFMGAYGTWSGGNDAQYDFVRADDTTWLGPVDLVTDRAVQGSFPAQGGVVARTFTAKRGIEGVPAAWGTDLGRILTAKRPILGESDWSTFFGRRVSAFRNTEGELEFAGDTSRITKFIKFVSGAFDSSGIVAGILKTYRAIEGAFGADGVLSRIVTFRRNTDGDVAQTGDVSRTGTLGRAMEGSLTSAGEVLRIATFIRAAEGVISFAGETLRVATFIRAVEGITSFAGTVAGVIVGAVSRAIEGVLPTAAGVVTRIHIRIRKITGNI